jgi:hypothetical protein
LRRLALGATHDTTNASNATAAAPPRALPRPPAPPFPTPLAARDRTAPKDVPDPTPPHTASRLRPSPAPLTPPQTSKPPPTRTHAPLSPPRTARTQRHASRRLAPTNYANYVHSPPPLRSHATNAATDLRSRHHRRTHAAITKARSGAPPPPRACVFLCAPSPRSRSCRATEHTVARRDVETQSAAATRALPTPNVATQHDRGGATPLTRRAIVQRRHESACARHLAPAAASSPRTGVRAAPFAFGGTSHRPSDTTCSRRRSVTRRVGGIVGGESDEREVVSKRERRVRKLLHADPQLSENCYTHTRSGDPLESVINNDSEPALRHCLTLLSILVCQTQSSQRLTPPPP